MIFVAACGGDGVDLEITSDVTFDRVELFLANDHCYDDSGGQLCEGGVAWMTAQERPPGETFVMKDDENIVETTTFRGSTAVMHLAATSEFRQPKVIAIVGFQGDTPVAYTTLWGVRIPANTAETWRVKLDTADPAIEDFETPPASGQAYHRVHAWKRERVANPSELSRCLALQSWDSTNGQWAGVFVVPDSDHDCDGQTIECRTLHANYKSPAEGNACVTPLGNTAPGACVLGASRCEDGVIADSACFTPLQALSCVPDAICTDCVDTSDVAACAVESIKANPLTSEVACTFAPADGGNLCGVRMTGTWTRFNVPAPCADVEVRPVAQPLDTSGSPHVAMVDNAKIDVRVSASSTTSCSVDLEWTSGTAASGTSAAFVFLIKGVTASNTAVLPVKISFGPPVSACADVAEPPLCDISDTLATDHMWSCL